MKENKIVRCIICGVIILLCFNSCKRTMGYAWYARSAAGSDTPPMYITGIEIKGIKVEACKTESGNGRAVINEGGFADADYYIINVPADVQEISVLDIKVEAVSSLTTMEKIKPEELEITVNGDEVHLSPGQFQPLTLIIKHNQKKYADINKIIKITQNEAPHLELIKLSVFGKSIDNPNTQTVNISVPYKETVITAANIKAEFKIGNDILTGRPIEISGGVIRLEEEVPAEITFIVNEIKGQYKKFEKTITVTREKRKAGEAAALEAEELEICGSVGAVGEVIVVPAEITKITKDDVNITFKDFEVPVTMSPEHIEFGASDTVKFTLSVPEKENAYLAWELEITVKKDTSGAVINNPKDKYNRPKYIQKIITEEIIQDPFEYYNEQSGGFSAEKFNTWILNMTSISSSDVASYIFKSGEWSGDDPAICEGPQISPGAMNSAWNLKYYKFKSRASRWADEDRFTPNLSEDEARKQSRFLFFKFTGDASMGTKLNNSMFCVDTYSKFLFFYSEPGNKKTVAGHIMPSDWRDYAAPSYGNAHTQSDIPFYLSDPVGYVLQNGTVVIYQWVKDNISVGNYNLRQTGEKQAEKKLSAPGYSPYKDSVKTKKTRIENTKNENYTVAEPIIKTQPRSIRAKLNTANDIAFKIRTAKAPEGEHITYQWYISDDFDVEGTPIADAVDSTYRPDKTKAIHKYCYCVVKNTNEENHETTEVKSEVVQLYIDETLIINAEKPRITEQPKNILLSLNEQKEIQLEVKAISMDKGVLSYQWYELVPNGETEEGKKIDDEAARKSAYTFTPGTSTVGEKRYYCVVTNTNEKADGQQEAEIKSNIVTIRVQEAYQVNFAKTGEGALTGILDRTTVITSGTYVPPGHSIMFIASPAAGYKIKSDGWTSEGGTIEYENVLKNIAVIQVAAEPVTVTAAFEKIPGKVLTIKAKSLENIDLDNYADENPSSWYTTFNPVKDYTYFEARFKANVNEEFQVMWSFDKHNGRVVKKSKKTNSGDDKVERYFGVGETPQAFELFTKLIKHDQNGVHAWKFSDTISDDSASDIERDKIKFKFVDDGNNGYWVLDIDPDKKLGKEKVTITLPQDFKLEYGHEKEFVIRYDLDNLSSSTNGSFEVTYTISWK